MLDKPGPKAAPKPLPDDCPIYATIAEDMAKHTGAMAEGVGTSIGHFIKANGPLLGKLALDGTLTALAIEFPEESGFIDKLKVMIDAKFAGR